jgi:hypothetical protein
MSTKADAALYMGKRCLLCAGEDSSCKWCFGTRVVYPQLYEAHDQERQYRDAWVPVAGPAVTLAEGDRLRLRWLRAEKLTAEQAETMNTMATAQPITDESAYATEGYTKEDMYGPFLAWHFLPPSSVPAVTFGVDAPKLCINEAHMDRILRDDVFGHFCGVPIVCMDELGMEVDRENDIYTLCGPARPYLVWYDLYSSEGTDESWVRPGKYYNPEYGTIKQSTHDNAPAEILPGEERCADGVIRRSTTTEVVGYDTYHNQAQTEAGQQRVGLEEARKAAAAGSVVYWRPNRATLEVYKVGTELPCLPKEPEPFALILQGGAQ